MSYTTMQYRPEIDGLRALAVLPVILFHANFAPFAGGYLGVDVFFVISGYLIASIILKELQGGSFSLLGFYERRVRRILPALFVVVAATTPFAWAWMSAEELANYSQSIISVFTFWSNIFFWLDSGYFDDAAAIKPLFHTWSLSIEEQFYILFPVTVLALWAVARRALFPLILLGLILSLACAEWGSRNYANAAFYLLPTRAWELLVGVALAYLENRNRRPVPAGATAEAMSALGLAALVLPMALFDESTRHPSLYTAVPVAGAALIIWFAGPATRVGRLLSVRWVVAIGLISYSLYLWHQPLFALARIYALDEPTLLQYCALIALSFALAALSWRFVERPFRRRSVIPARAVWAAAPLAIAPLIAFGYVGEASKGFPQRLDARAAEILAAKRENANRHFRQNGRKCQGRRNPDKACVIGDTGAPVAWALVGDSHAGAVAEAFSQALAARGLAGRQYTLAACPVVDGMERADPGGRGWCKAFAPAVFQALETQPIESVVLVARYTLYLEGTVFDNGEGGVERTAPVWFAPIGAKDLDETARRAAVSEAYAQSVRRLLDAGKTVYLVYPIPEVGWHVPRRLSKMRWRGMEDQLTTSYHRYRERNAGVFRAFDAIDDHPRLHRIYPHKVFCESDPDGGGRCMTHDGDRPYYVDDDHLSPDGARLLIDRLFDAAGDPAHAVGDGRPAQ